MKIFISSTYEDLKTYRQSAIEVVNRYKYVPLAMELFMARPQEPEKLCGKEIRECDIFVGIYAHRYGFIPEGKGKSITQLEYELAIKLKKDCLCFIVEERYPWDPGLIEMDKHSNLKAFLGIIKKERTFVYFESPKDFESKLATSLGKFIAEQKAETAKTWEAIIPMAPSPFIAHPYPLPENFTGRDAEIAALSNWFYNEKKPVLIMEAIGGMGKTALTWVWLHQEVIEKPVELQGIFWWSFYEAPFETFLQHLECYVLRKENDQESLLSTDLAKLQAALHSNRFLLVLDGLERALRGYAGMEAMFIQEKKFQGDKSAETQWDQHMREPVNHMATRFLKHLASMGGKSKTLITTRLMPTPLEGLSGVKHIFLKGYSGGEAVRFLRSEGVKGTRSELEQAGKVYDFHPLMLKLLSSSIKRSRTQDINEAFRQNLINRQEPYTILKTCFNFLSKQEKKVATHISIFRSAFTFDSAKAIFPEMNENPFWQVMQELRSLGFLFYDEKEDCFDFHPIMRSFLYNNLTNSTAVHNLAAQYFQSMPKVEKIIHLKDISPLIELYHHLVKAGKLDEAYILYEGRISKHAYYQLSAYHLIIELLKEFFPEGEDHLPCLKDESHQASIVNDLALAYSLSGQPLKAVPLFFQNIRISEKIGYKGKISIPLENVAYMSQIKLGQLSASIAHLRKAFALFMEMERLSSVQIVYDELGFVLAYQGRAISAEEIMPPFLENLYVEDEFYRSYKSFYYKHTNWLELEPISRSLSALMQARLAAVLPDEEKNYVTHIMEALEQASEALKFAERDIITDYPIPIKFVRTYWLLGVALIQCHLSTSNVPIEYLYISFYNDSFQQQVESVTVKSGKELEVAERCLHEALHRCRKSNIVDMEPDILLALARMEWTKLYSQSKTKELNRLPTIEEKLKEAHDIAQLSDYRLVLADLHLFCGQVLLELKEKHTLLDLTAHQHLQKAKEYTLDVSEFTDIYQSQDPHFYDNIHEYQMLKRGMTQEERIKNGYYVAYKIAEALEDIGES